MDLKISMLFNASGCNITLKHKRMETSNERSVDDPALLSHKEFLQIVCNWQISNNKQFHEAFTVTTSSQESKNTDIKDIVFLDTCISLQPNDPNNEACMLHIKVTNGQKISKIAIVSEAYVLEFFKQYGEYETTVSAELVDEFECNSVYFAETSILPHTTEASIKFARVKSQNSTVWVYGIRLYLTDVNKESNNFPTEVLNSEILKSFFTKLNINPGNGNITNDIQSYYRNLTNLSQCKNVRDINDEGVAQSSNENTVECNVNLVTYIDKKFEEMEERLTKRINKMELEMNKKLDIILKHLETNDVK